MAPSAQVFQFGVKVDGILQPGTIFVMSFPPVPPVFFEEQPSSDNRRQLVGTCVVSVPSDSSVITLVNLSGGTIVLNAGFTGFDTNSASTSVHRLGDIPV